MSFNANSPTIRRLMSELKELKKHPESDFVAGPVGEDLFVWHFTIKGPRDSPFEGGIYHGKIVFPQQYPYSPPDIYFLTPNGRFETNRKICLTMTSFHPDEWNPAWDVRTTLTSIIAFMPTPAEGAVGAIDMPESDRRKLAQASHDWHCKECELAIEPDEIQTPNEAGSQQQPSEQEESQPQANATTIEEEESDSESVDPDKNTADDLNFNVEFEIDEGTAQHIETQLHNEETTEIKQEMEQGHEENQEQNDKQENDKEVHENTETDNVYIDEDGISHYSYEDMRSVPIEKKQNFVPILDIPILILFFLLMFLIANSAFHFVDFFDYH